MVLHKTFWLVTAVLLSGLVSAQQADESAQAADTLFIEAAAASNVFEIGSARLAVENAENQDTKDLAQTIIDDHTKAESQLLQVAEGLDARPNSDLTSAQQLMLNYLRTLSGAEFDAEYLKQQVVVHREAVGLFEIASSTVQDQQLKAFVDETLPVLEKHTQMVVDLAQ